MFRFILTAFVLFLIIRYVRRLFTTIASNGQRSEIPQSEKPFQQEIKKMDIEDARWKDIE